MISSSIPVALPFAFLEGDGGRGLPTWQHIVWITLAMVGARSAAMTFNRIARGEIACEEPRTANRELPSGKLSGEFAWVFLLSQSGSSYSRRFTELANVRAFACRSDQRPRLFNAKRFTAFAHLLLAGHCHLTAAAWIAVRERRFRSAALLSLFV